MGIRSLGGQEGPDGKPASVFYDVWGSTGLESVGPNIDSDYGNPTGHDATGGIISDYSTPPGDVYRCHLFNSSGSSPILVCT